MKILPLIFALALGTLALGAPALPLKFKNVPLGNVVRVLSARFHAPVTVAAHATAPITGDLSGLDFPKALAVVAAQAGLAVRSLGSDPASGYALEMPGTGDSQVGSAPSDAAVKEALEAAARHRADLLRQREALLKQASGQEAGS